MSAPALRIGGLGRALISLVAALCVGFLAIIGWGAYAAVDTLSNEAIERAAGQTETELDRFFEPVEANLGTALGWATRGALNPRDIERMNGRFIPFLGSMRQVSSMLIATPDGVEYMLLKDGDSWRTRSTDVQARPGTTLWNRWSEDGARLDATFRDMDYDPRERPWFLGASGAPRGELTWTEPYTFFTTKEPGMTVSSRVATPQGELIIAFDVLLLDVSRFTSTLEVSPRGKAFVLTEDAKVLGLPRAPAFADDEARRAAVLKAATALGLAEVRDAAAAWANRSVVGLEFDSGGEPWLGAFRERKLRNRTLWIGVVVPTADFKGSLAAQRWALVALAVIGVLIATWVAVFFARRYEQELEEAVDEVRDQLGQYQLEQKIGQGGMGAVYRGSHLLMRREVAVKIVRGDKLSAEYVKRFEREVRVTSRLSHPNTVQIFDYGITDDGTFYYVMELLNGVSLATFIETVGAVSSARCIYLLRQICESLREAHDAGLVHRDIKPGNLHLCERGQSYDFVKVLDFGLVKDANPGTETALTGETAFGTPGFVAPEAIRDSRKATPASDIYAVGAVAFALLAGRAIFAETNKVKLLLRQLKEDPTPPSALVDLPIADDLERLVMAMIQREPNSRPESMSEVLDALDECADAGGWTARDARRWWSENEHRFEAPKPTSSKEESATISVDLLTRRG